jgi:adenosine deaminase
MENIIDRIQSMPKAELHLHLDGSLSEKFIKKRA